jgi:N-acetylglucosamine-6-phosphate deacetylase
MVLLFNTTLILERQLLSDGAVLLEGDRIRAVGKRCEFDVPDGTTKIDLKGDYLSPGFIDLHVHGGNGHDFMDLTAEAFREVARCHLRHGTTGLTPTTTVGNLAGHLRFLELTQEAQSPDFPSRVLGAHLYGPYFNPEAKGCHPGTELTQPKPNETEQLLRFASVIASATVAPELEGAEEYVRRCRHAGIHCNVGHSYATFEQMQAAIQWGVRHVDHLFCAMSDRAKLRLSQTYPMRGGLMEATLFFDELTSELIADGKHLSPELLRLAFKIKGPDRLALVTDANRAVDQPDGEYWFGPHGHGEPILRRDDVGLMPDGKSLASGVMGMDHLVRTMLKSTEASLPEVIRMATLTPARIIGRDHDLGSLRVGKLADLVVLDSDLHIQRIFLRGREIDLA